MVSAAVHFCCVLTKGPDAEQMIPSRPFFERIKYHKPFEFEVQMRHTDHPSKRTLFLVNHEVAGVRLKNLIEENTQGRIPQLVSTHMAASTASYSSERVKTFQISTRALQF